MKFYETTNRKWRTRSLPWLPDSLAQPPGRELASNTLAVPENRPGSRCSPPHQSCARWFRQQRISCRLYLSLYLEETGEGMSEWKVMMNWRNEWMGGDESLLMSWWMGEFAPIGILSFCEPLLTKRRKAGERETDGWMACTFRVQWFP